MDDSIMVVVIVALACSVAVMSQIIGTIRAAINRRGTQASGTLVSEIQAMRDEMRQLRQQNTDLILTLDSSLGNIDRRLEFLEGRGTLASGTIHSAMPGQAHAEGLEQRVGLSR